MQSDDTSTRYFLPIAGVNDYMFDGHYGASPSGAERWMRCTASVSQARRFLETLTPNQQKEFASGSSAAREGTTAHAVAEAKIRAMLGDIDETELKTTLMELAIMPEEGEGYDDEMDEHVDEYVDLVKTYADAEREVLVEQRVMAAIPLTGSHDGEVYTISGSTDVTVLPTEDEPELVVGDLKYGKGMDVSVDANPQARIYALGVLELLSDEDGNLTTDIETVTYHIVQPRLGGVKTWSEPLEDLLDWRDDVLAPALTAALYGKDEGAVFAPSDETCQWCPARGDCPALAEERFAKASDMFDAVVEAEYENGPGSFPETDTLSDERLGSLLEQALSVEKLAAELKAEAQRRLFRGAKVPGFKLVNYQPSRKWSDEAEELLSDHPLLWKSRLVTPKQALDILAAEKADASEVEALIEKPDVRPVIGKENDRRKAWEGKPPEAMFNDESEAG